MAHPHVERAGEPERKAALGLIELHRGDADVHHDAIDGVDTLGGAHAVEVGEAILDQGQPSGRTVDQIEPARYRRPIPIDADDTGTRGIENGAAVAAGAEGRIDVNAAVMGSEQLDRFAAEDRNMTQAGRAHPPASGVSHGKIRKLDANEPIAPRISALRRAFPAKKPP